MIVYETNRHYWVSNEDRSAVVEEISWWCKIFGEGLGLAGNKRRNDKEGLVFFVSRSSLEFSRDSLAL